MGLTAALPIACDALNARTVAVREYHYTFCAFVAHKALTPVLRHDVDHSAFPHKEKRHSAPAVRLGAKGTYPICPILRCRYLAGFLCQGSFVIFGQQRGKG
ncbi:hypothetical protein SMU33_04603 [Streptococcus mutans 11SSST2]|nr:hypothetical protein SMU33_04603 [Streptococcus mutans 11SSST2]